jgi:uncharacterized protein with HEPN domain
MSKHDPRVTLRQIADFARQAQNLCAGYTLDSLLKDWKTMLALERVMELIGESVKPLSQELRDRYPAVPWKAIAGMRDHLSHGKSVLMGRGANNPVTILWNAVQNDIPILLLTVEQMLRDLE